MGNPVTASKNNVVSGLLAGAITSGMVAASLITPASANAWCVGISGINIGGGCSSTFGNFALGLGDNAIAISRGFITGAIALGDSVAGADGILTAAWAGGNGSYAETQGLVSWAVSQGTNVAALAGAGDVDIANFAFNFGNAVTAPFAVDSDGASIPGQSLVEASYGNFLLAANLGGNANAVEGVTKDLYVGAGGSPNPTPDDPTTADIRTGTALALNLFGNRNHVEAFGNIIAAIAVGNPFGFPNGSDSTVQVGDYGTATHGGMLGLAFNVQPPFITQSCSTGQCGNNVFVQNALFTIGGALGLVNKQVIKSGPGIKINTPLNPAPPIPAPTSTAAQVHSLVSPVAASAEAPTARTSLKDKLTNSPSKLRHAVSGAKRAGKASNHRGHSHNH